MSEEQKMTREGRVEQLAISVAFQLEAVARILERKGLVSREELVTEIEKLQKEQEEMRNQS